MLKTGHLRNWRDLKGGFGPTGLDFITILAGRLIQVILLVVTLRVMTGILSEREVGTVGILLASATMFVWFPLAPISNYVSRHTFAWWQRGSLWSNYARFSLYVGAWSLASVPLLYLWNAISAQSWNAGGIWLVAVSAYIFFSVMGPMLAGALNILNRRRAFVTLTVATQFFCLLASYLMVRSNPNGVFWLLGQAMGFAVGTCAGVFLFMWQAAPDALPSSSKQESAHEKLSDVLRFSLPLFVTGGIYWVEFQGYRPIIGAMTSLEFLGLFYAGYAVSAGIFSTIETLSNQFITPYFYRHIEQAPVERRLDFWAVYVSTLYPIMILLAAATVALSGPISRLLLDQQFWGASSFIALAAVVETCRMLGISAALGAHADKRTDLLIWPYAMGGVSLLVLLVAGIRMFGTAAVAPALIASSAVFVLAVHLRLVRHSGVKTRIFGPYYVLGALIALAGLWFLLPILFTGGWIGNVIACLLGGVIVAISAVGVAKHAKREIAERL